MGKKRYCKLVAKIGCIGFVILAIFAAVFAWVVRDAWSQQAIEEAHVPTENTLDNLLPGMVLEQDFFANGAALRKLTLYPANPQNASGTLHVDVLHDGAAVAQASAPIEEMGNITPYTLPLPWDFDAIPSGTPLTLRITVERESTDQYFSLYYGTTMSVGRYQMEIQDQDSLRVDGTPVKGKLSFNTFGIRKLNTMTYYNYAAVGILLLYAAVMVWIYDCCRRQKRCIIIILVEEIHRFSFLMERLVGRDFNTKYRQSLLGVLWSFLNPILTMTVQYFVFSTLFKSNIPNFVVYLMTGIIFFNFFNESVSLGLESITSNASLINKVYVPKYIYPLSRVISSMINLLLSLIPLFALTVITGLPITKAFLLLPIPILCMFTFTCAMSFMLATSNVFFRDTRFLWSVVAMMWSYLTPLFYPESIIPQQFITLYHLNPLYQFIYFIRCIFLQGITPQPSTYLYCILSAVIPLIFGLWVFHKNQNKFVLYL